MKFGFGKSIFFMSVSALASAMFARGLVSTFQYDIFDKCITNPEAATDYMCRNANDLLQVITFAVASLTFFAILTVFWPRLYSRRRNMITSAVLSLGFFGLLVANWQIVSGLQDNFFELFQLKRGIPDRPTEYGYILFNRLGDVFAGVLLGVFAWMTTASDKGAIDASKRNEPRLEMGATKPAVSAPAKKKTPVKKTAVKKKTPAKKPAAKKTTAKK